MKRMLSVFLSVVLLVSSVVIPMSVSAAAPTEQEKIDAFNAVVNAVKNLDLDLNNVNPIEYAVPTGSVGGADNTGKSTISTVSGVAEKVILGDKIVEITGDNKVTSVNTPGGLVADHLHAIEYTPWSNVYQHLYKVGYFVIYVKTARPIKLSLGAQNGMTQNINFLNGENAIDVPATGDGYTPVAINIQSGIDWTQPVLGGSNAKRLYAAEHCLKKLLVSVQEMTDGDNAIKDTDGITFGSAFYVPVDENVRDFRFNVTTFRNGGSVNGDVTDRFSELSAEMIAAAEAIDNTHGNYTAESFKDLQNAIKTAKEVFIAGGGDVVDLFKAEVENLYTLEEVCRPTSVDRVMTNLPSANASDIIINGKPLSDKQQEYFGESLVKVDNTTGTVRLTDKGSSDSVPGLGDHVKKFKDYKNLYFAVANTGDVQNSVQFTSYNQWHTAVNYINRQDSSWNRQLILKNGFNLISLYDLGVNVDDKKVTEAGNTVTYYIRDNNVLYYSDYMLKYDTSEYKDYYDGFNVFNVVYGSLPAGTSLYIGSLMGEKPFNTTDTGLDNVTDKAKVIAYYDTNIKDKGYIGTDDIEKTFSALGLFEIPVTGLYNPADIVFTGGYTFDAVLPGETLTFKINNVPSDVDVSVTYGGALVNKVGDVYTLTDLAENKQLVINLSHITTEFLSEKNVDSFNQHYLGNDNNLALGKDAVVLTSYNYNSENKTYGNRQQSESFVTHNYTDGSYVKTDTRDSGINTPISYYNETGGICRNGYETYAEDDEGNTPAEFDFDRSQSGDAPFECYTDIIYDLGYVANINKLQHIGIFGNYNADLSLGAYQIYAAEHIEDLFDKTKDSLVLNYQNKTLVTKGELYNGQIHEFPTRRARFVAIRVYCSFTQFRSTANSNALYIEEIGIYGSIPEGTTVPDYNISSGKFGDMWIGGSQINVSTPAGTESLLQPENATAYAKKGNIEYNFEGLELTNLNDLQYLASGKYVEFTGFNFWNGQKLKNGYNISRDNAGYISFTQDENPTIDTYLDITYDMKDYYNVKEFLLCEMPGRSYARIQAYKLYIGNDRESLYENEENVVVYYENLFNCGGQIITFDSPKPGRYLGLRILLNTPYSTSSEVVRFSEIAAFGTPVAAPADNELKPNENFNSSAAYIFNDKTYGENGSSVYVKDNEGNPTTEDIESATADDLRTSMRLALRYECQFTDGSPDADTIKLANGQYAKILSKSIIAAKYDANVTYDDESFGINPTVPNANVVTSTESLRKYFAIDDTNKTQVSVTLNLKNMKSSLKDTRFVFRGRIVYQTADGSIYACYTQISNPITAESAHGELDTKWFQ